MADMVTQNVYGKHFPLLTKKKEFKEKKNHINTKTKPRWLKMFNMLTLNHKLPYNFKMLRFLIFSSDHSQTYWNGYAYTLARFPSDFLK